MILFRLFLILILSLKLIANDSIYKVNLFKFAEIVSANSNVNILINKQVQGNTIYFYLPKVLNNFDYLMAFNDLLKDDNLTLVKKQNFYYVTYPKKIVIKKFLHQYKFRYLNIGNIKFLKNIFPDVKFHFFKSSNTFFVRCSAKKYISILKIITSLDKPYLSKKISMSIFLVNLNKAKNYGMQLKKFGLSLNNLISFTQNSISLSSSNLLAYQSAISFLQSKGAVHILQNPILLLTDNKKVTFQSGVNIPYISSTTSVKNTTVSSQKNIQYKNVGLKIVINPRIFKNYLFLNLHLSSQNLLDNSQTPKTSVLSYSNSFRLDFNHSLLLTGLNIIQKNLHISKVPILGDIPFINPLFKSKTFTKSSSILTILIKVLK